MSNKRLLLTGPAALPACGQRFLNADKHPGRQIGVLRKLRFAKSKICRESIERSNTKPFTVAGWHLARQQGRRALKAKYRFVNDPK
jgi:hypothetical protein